MRIRKLALVLHVYIFHSGVSCIAEKRNFYNQTIKCKFIIRFCFLNYYLFGSLSLSVQFHANMLVSISRA